ncbi:MAG TPA: foldase [Firmicutes bacterium]|nr:foldase [Bacillota bacterium]
MIGVFDAEKGEGRGVKHKTGVVIVITLAVALLVACGVWYIYSDINAVAKVNGKAISWSSFHKALEHQGGKQVLSAMIREELIRQAAAREGISASKADIDEEMSNLVKQFGSEAAFESVLTQYGMTKKDVLDQIEVSLLLNALATKDVTVTDEELLKYYNEHKADFKEPEQVRARHILVFDEKEAKGILAQLKSGADFAKMAKEKSKDPGTKDKGGDLGYFQRGTMDPEFEKAAFSLGVGQTSGIVKSAYGYHIIRVEARKPERQLAFDEVKGRIEKQVKRDKAKPAGEVIAGLARNARIKINSKSLRSVLDTLAY